MDHFTSGRPSLLDATAESGHDEDGVYDEETSQIVAEIKDLLDTRIRPAVAQDGGDIVFSKFEAGHRRGLAAHARRLLGLPVLVGHAEGRASRTCSSTMCRK